MKLYYINAKKVVQLQQIEVEAENEAEAAQKYLVMARNNGVGLDDYEWYTMTEGDLEIDCHGEVEPTTREQGKGKTE